GEKLIRCLPLGMTNNLPSLSRRRQAAGLALLALGLVLIVAGAIRLLAPNAYKSVARLRIDPDSATQPSPNQGGRYDPYFIQTELEVIQSQLVLGRVVEELGLNRE